VRLFICGLVVGLFQGILQLSEQSLSSNGSGKVPLIDPHTEFWYQINTAETIMTYMITVVTITTQITLYFWHKQQKSSKGKAIIQPILQSSTQGIEYSLLKKT
jgi:hypothetical protein